MALSGSGRIGEYLAAGLWTGAPARPIYGRTNAITKEIIGRAP
jgi:hypothetical protein